ncbi:MAG TPA: hypothetical protein PK992_04825, partial [Planctomycetaceae bacterium]|nr:hypothetical protein [Planctomycetaceae bacterium]
TIEQQLLQTDRKHHPSIGDEIGVQLSDFPTKPELILWLVLDNRKSIVAHRADAGPVILNQV